MIKYRHITHLSALLVLAACLAGCSKNEVLTGGESSLPMLFSTYSASRTATKADASYVAPGQTSLPANSSFGVFAFYQEGNVATNTVAHWNATRTPDFMFNEEVTFDGTDYTYSPLRYWPSNEENTISFWAYYPYGAYTAGNTGALKLYESDALTSAYNNSSASGLPVATYTVNASPANQQDLLLETFTNWDMTYESCDPEDGIVPLKFRHALSLVQFAVEMPDGAGNEGTDFFFEFNNLQLNQVPTYGKCSDVSAATLLWSDQGNAQNIATTVYDSVTGKSEAFILMPQTLPNTLTLDFDVLLKFPSADDPDNRAADLAYPFQKSGVQMNLVEDASDNPITTWEAGKRYTYTIKLSLDKIEFSATVTAWDPETNVTIND